ncbi:hypothetical protein, partial [Nostoc edaphicum]|uniref:hypothetical protein n=1 Tax=Nostoc edaphicum TaxID=264686 RepID=UPI001D132AFD
GFIYVKGLHESLFTKFLDIQKLVRSQSSVTWLHNRWRRVLPLHVAVTSDFNFQLHKLVGGSRKLLSCDSGRLVELCK